MNKESLELMSAALQAKYLLKTFIANHDDTVIHENVDPIVERLEKAILDVAANAGVDSSQVWPAKDFAFLRSRFIQERGDHLPTEMVECGFCGVALLRAFARDGKSIFSPCCAELPTIPHPPSDYWIACPDCDDKRQAGQLSVSFEELAKRAEEK